MGLQTAASGGGAAPLQPAACAGAGGLLPAGSGPQPLQPAACGPSLGALQPLQAAASGAQPPPMPSGAQPSDDVLSFGLLCEWRGARATGPLRAALQLQLL